MARKSTPAPTIQESKLNEAVLKQDTAALNQLAVLEIEQNQNVTALAQKLGYMGSTDMGALENSARDAKEYLGKSIYMLGSCLLLLKEGSKHGQFLPVLNGLGIDVDTAQRYMAMTRRFANTAMSRHLEKLGFSKMAELLPLDDDQIDRLVDWGQTGELALDKVATMSVKELRAAVREAKADKEASEKLLADKNAKIDKLSRRIAKATPDDVLLELQKEATVLMNDALGCIRGQLRQAFIALKNHTDADHTLFMAGLAGQVQADLTALRQEFHLPDISTAADQALLAEQAQWANT